MTKTYRTTATWLLVALLAANHQVCVRSQSPTQTTTAQTQPTQQQQQQQPPNLVQGTMNSLSNGIPSIPNNNNNNNNGGTVQPLSPQQQQQLQQQQQPLRNPSNVIPQQIPAQAGGQFSMQTNDGQMPMNGLPQNGQPMMTSNGQPQNGQPMMTMNGQQLPVPNYNPQQQVPNVQSTFVPPKQIFNPQQGELQSQQQQQQWTPQGTAPLMQQPQNQMQLPQNQMQLPQNQMQLPQNQMQLPQNQMQQPQNQMQQVSPLQGQQYAQQVPPSQGQQYAQQVPPSQGQQYAQQYQQTPSRPVQVTMPLPQQQQYTVQQPYGGVQPVQGYQNPNPQQYQNTAGINPNQGYTNVQTTTAGQQIPGNNNQTPQRQSSSGSPLTAAFTLLDPMPLGKTALDTATSTIGSVMNIGTGIKDAAGGAAVDFLNKFVDTSEGMIQGMFDMAATAPATVAGMKRKGIKTAASLLKLPNSRQQQQQQIQQQQKQLQQQQQQLQQLQQQQGYYQQSNQPNPPQYSYQATAQGGTNPVNVPQPIVRYGPMGSGT